MAEGVAEYAEPGKETYRILILENALKTMDATYAGKPVYVQHVEEVDLENIQNEADGYVMESFFNQPDGKHWTKFIAVSDKAHEAIRRGWQLSNSYVPKSTTKGGEWHGVEYQQEITAGEYEHLAIVPNPRYAESIIMTPEEFKQYNEDKKVELERLSNSQDEKEKPNMGAKLAFWKRSKVENAMDPELSVVLPKSGKEITIAELVSEADERAAKKKNSMAEPHDKVKMHDGNMCNVAELVDKHKALHDELESMKSKKDDAKEEEGEVDMGEEAVDVEGDDKSKDNDDPSDLDDEGAIEEDKKENDDMEEDDDASMDNGEDDEAKKKALQLAEHEDKEIEAAKKKKNAADAAYRAIVAKKAGEKKSNAVDREALARKKLAAEKADRLRNANLNFEPEEVTTVELSADRVQRGKSRYGSN